MALDEQDLASIKELIAAASTESEKKLTKMVNGAMATTKGLKERLDTVPDSDGLAAAIKAQVDAAAAELAKKIPAPSASGAAGAPAVDEATKKLVEDLKAANETLMTKLRKGEEERKTERETRLASEEKQAISAMLSKLQVKPSLLEPALDHIRARGMVKRGSDGTIVVERKDDIGGTELVTLEEGLTAWTKTDVGKEFLPPRDVGGSGNTGSGGRRTGNAGGLPMPSLADLAQAVREASDQ